MITIKKSMKIVFYSKKYFVHEKNNTNNVVYVNLTFHRHEKILISVEKRLHVTLYFFACSVDII